MKNLIAEAPKEDIFGGGFSPPTAAYSEGSAEGGGSVSNMEIFLSNLIGFLTILGAIFFIFYFVQGALQWILAGGDSGKIQKARDTMLNGVIGLIVIVAAYSLIGVIGSVIGLEILNPSSMIQSIIPKAE